MGRILLVEDDALLGDGVKAGLEDDGHVVDWVTDGRQGLEAISAGHYTTAVLDLGLPRMDGLALLRASRERGDSTPVLVLTARDTVEDRVKGLDAGADDYLVKPFELAELKARVRALERRAAGQPQNLINHRGVTLDRATREVRYAGHPVPLSAREQALLEVMIERPGRPFTRSELEDRLYGWGREVESNAIEVHVHHLRAKLYPELIRTVRGVGYVIDADG
jgi:two-component system, OmpR family, response regulator QseB